MADSELGELRRPPRPTEARIARMGGWRSQGLVGGTSDTPVPVDYGADGVTLTGEGDDGEPTPDWFAEAFTLTAAAAATLTLTYAPVEFGEILRLNGVTLTRGVNYTVDDRVVTWVTLSALILGIGADSWQLAATYPYYDAAAPPEPEIANTFAAVATASPGRYTVDLPSAPAIGDVAIIIAPDGAVGFTGAFATWTKVFDDATYGLAMWIGTGVGSGVTVTHTDTGSIIEYPHFVGAVYRVDGTLTIADSASTHMVTPGSTPITAPNRTTAVGNIVITAVRAGIWLEACYPDSTHSETGFTGSFVLCRSVGGYGAGTAMSTGIATTAGTVGGTFGLTFSSTACDAQAVTFIMAVT